MSITDAERLRNGIKEIQRFLDESRYGDASFTAAALLSGAFEVGVRTGIGGTLVYCVACLGDERFEIVHIFSTKEKADEFGRNDPRRIISYDYVIDHPERCEDRAQ